MINFTKTISAIVLISAVACGSAFANSARDSGVKAAAELTLAKTQEAVELLDKGGDKAEVSKLLNDIRQSQKEFRYEQTERLRQKAGDKIRLSKEALDKGDTNEAKTELKAALDFYQQMMVIYKAAH